MITSPSGLNFRIIKMRNVALLVGTISIWAILILTVEGLPWDLANENADTYTTMLKDVREQVQGTICFEIPKIAKPPKTNYVIVDIKGGNTETARVALKGADLYVVGYADTYIDPKTKKPLERAFLLKPQKGENFMDAFPNAKVEQLPYTGTYRDLEKKTNAGDRKNIVLTRSAILALVKEISGKEIKAINKKKQAQFILTSIQMIAEAARFKYMQDKLKSNYGQYNFKPDEKMLTLQNNWDRISAAVVNAQTNGDIKPALDLKGPEGTTYRYKASKVDEVRKDVALLSAVNGKCKRERALQNDTTEFPVALSDTLVHA